MTAVIPRVALGRRALGGRKQVAASLRSCLMSGHGMCAHGMCGPLRLEPAPPTLTAVRWRLWEPKRHRLLDHAVHRHFSITSVRCLALPSPAPPRTGEDMPPR